LVFGSAEAARLPLRPLHLRTWPERSSATSRSDGGWQGGWHELLTDDVEKAFDYYSRHYGWQKDYAPNESVSSIIFTEDQAETDRLWNAIVSNGGRESTCGWCKDRWDFSWQITPRALLAATQDPDRAAAKRR
jgi:hypothetical protein